MRNKDEYIGNYCIIKKISNGAFGDVYLAKHTFLTNHIVAIKVLRSVHHASSQERDRFFEEAQFLNKLKHPHILSIIDVGVHEGCPYLVTEYASKGSLRDLLQRQSPHLLPIEESINILIQVGQALDYAHQQNIIHRDLKPENILFNAEGKAILADFGIATVLNTATRQTATMGTFNYMAPEQFRNTIAKQSDQYALGCVAYELFTGHMVFETSDAATAMMKCLVETPAKLRTYNSKLPLSIEEAVLKVLAKERADRHADVATFIAELSLSVAPQHNTPNTSKAGTLDADEKIYTHWMSIATAHSKAERYEDALTAYQQLILRGYKNADILYYKGNMLWHLEHYQEALETFQSAVDLDSEHVDAHCGRGYALLYLDKKEEALSAFASAVSLDNNHIPSYMGRGKVLESLRHYKSALIAFERVIYLDTDNLSAWQSKGSILLALKQYKEALRVCDYTIRINNTISYNHYMKGVTLQLLERYQEAIISYDRAINIDPHNSVNSYSLKGQILEKMNLYQEAITVYEQALKLNPDMPNILDSKIRLQKMLQEPLKTSGLIEDDEDENEDYGDEDYDEDVDETEDDDVDEVEDHVYHYSDNVTGAIAYYHQGVRLKQKQQYEQASQAFKKAIQLVPSFTNAYHELGFALQQLKRDREALVTYEQAIKLASTEPSLYKSKAQLLEKLGRLEEAAQSYAVAKALTENAIKR